jgi:hypothetical protein
MVMRSEARWCGWRNRFTQLLHFGNLAPIVELPDSLDHLAVLSLNRELGPLRLGFFIGHDGAGIPEVRRFLDGWEWILVSPSLLLVSVFLQE